mgnify:CR=1 FL=1
MLSDNLKKIIPNFITLSNLFLGFVSIILLSQSFEYDNYIRIACYLIFIAAFLDTVDGKIARKLGISSDFGKEIDSLADLVSFCLVPSFLLFTWYIKFSEINFYFLILLSSFPVLFGAIRLAKYNVMRNMRESIKYIGMPTPANAIFICALVLFSMNNTIYILPDVYPHPVYSMKLPIFKWMYTFLGFILKNDFSILLLSIFSSFLLMSSADYNKFPLISFKINKKNNIDLFNLILFILILLASVWLNYYDIVLLFFILIYIFGNLGRYFFLKVINKKEGININES